MRAHTISTTAAVVSLAFLALGTGRTPSRGETLARSPPATAPRSPPAAANGSATPTASTPARRWPPRGARRAPTLHRAGRRHLGTIAAATARRVAQPWWRSTALPNPNLIRVGQVLTLPAGGQLRRRRLHRHPGRRGHHPRRAGGRDHRRHRGPLRHLPGAAGRPPTASPAAGSTRASASGSCRAAGTGAAGGGQHRTRCSAGDTLSGIAQRLGTTVRALQDANGIGDPDTVVGSAGRLKHPGGRDGGGCRSAARCRGPITVHERLGLPPLRRALPRGQRPLRRPGARPWSPRCRAPWCRPRAGSAATR